MSETNEQISVLCEPWLQLFPTKRKICAGNTNVTAWSWYIYHLCKHSFRQTQNCDNPRRDRTRYCKHPPQIIFRRMYFPTHFVNARARHAPTKIATFAGHFLRIRTELRHGHYGNNRSRISPAINSGSVYKPRIYDRECCRCNTGRLLHQWLLLLLPLQLLLLLLLLLHRGATFRERSRIKSRKIENETASCRVTVRLSARDEGGEKRAMVETKDTRRCGFSYLVKSHHAFFFACPPLAENGYAPIRHGWWFAWWWQLPSASYRTKRSLKKIRCDKNESSFRCRPFRGMPSPPDSVKAN